MYLLEVVRRCEMVSQVSHCYLPPYINCQFLLWEYYYVKDLIILWVLATFKNNVMIIDFHVTCTVCTTCL